MLYVRPTKRLAAITIGVVIFAVVAVVTIALTLGQELGRMDAQRQVHTHIEGN